MTGRIGRDIAFAGVADIVLLAAANVLHLSDLDAALKTATMFCVFIAAIFQTLYAIHRYRNARRK